jgi:uncharacterized protein YbcV (DUF1398 family)
MNTNAMDVARATLEGSESGEMNFPQGVQMLMQAGFDGYAVDLRRSARIYYMPDGEVIELATAPTSAPVAERFDAAVVREAIREAQTMVPGYTYAGFCAKVAGAGCAGYLVPFPGRRVLYYGSHRRDPYGALPRRPLTAAGALALATRDSLQPSTLAETALTWRPTSP